MQKPDKETLELISSYQISRHAAECYRIDVFTKGKQFEEKYIRECDAHLKYRYKLLEKLAITGPVDDDGNIWSVEIMEENAKKEYERLCSP